MLNRRHIRIKLLQILYSYRQSKEDNIELGVKELFHSIDRMYDLYILLMTSLNELKHMAELKLEERKSKIRPTSEDLNPNLKLVENELINSLANNKVLIGVSNQRKVNWLGVEKQELFRKMFNDVLESETYFNYMNNGLQGALEDSEFAIQIFKNEIINSKYLINFFEDENIYWQDDLDLCASMTIKSLKTWKQTKKCEVLPMFKPNDDEKEFMTKLFRYAVLHQEENEILISKFSDNWEFDRIAKMDVYLLELAISELLIFQEIPTKVTLNEYIEISKFYSTPRSNQFINGVLDKIIDYLKKEKKLIKTGRGLVN